MMEALKSFNWKRHGNTLLKVLMDLKVVGLLAMFGFTLYGIGWDTVWRPSMDALKSRDDAIVAQKEALTKKTAKQKQYAELKKQLEDLDTTMLPILPGQSPSVIAVEEMVEIMALAKGQGRDATLLPTLPLPHATRDGVTLTPTGSITMELAKPEAATTNAASDKAQPSSAQPGSEGSTSPQTNPVDRFNYDLKVTGTYPALMDLLNQLILRKSLVQLNKVQISRSPSAPEQPDAKDYPDFPVQLEMSVSLSIFLYASPGA